MKLAARAWATRTSPTMRIAGRAIELRAAGHEIVDLSVGEPDLPTPEPVKEAGRRAITENRTRYTANEGLRELREAIAARLETELGLSYGSDEILVSSGAKASLYLAAMALFEEGDEVVLVAPYWVSYPAQLRLAGATPVVVRTGIEQGFRLDAHALRQAVTPRTRGVILNYPANPTGVCYTADELRSLAEVCLECDLVVLADEIYEKLLYDGRTFTSIGALHPGMRERTVIVNGVSKAFAMTGWRLGYAAGPREVIAAMARLQSHMTSHPSSISQWAALEALRGGGDAVEAMRQRFERRRDAMLRALSELPGVRWVVPEGAFYVLVDVRAWLEPERDGPRASAEALGLHLLEEAGVAVVPGEGFGAPGHLRLSFACEEATIGAGVGRIREALLRLGEPRGAE